MDKERGGFLAGMLTLPGGSSFWLWMGAVLIYACVVQWVDDHYFPTKKFVEADAVMYTGVIMGLLLVFRTNSAYERWWEARKLWGQLVNDTRNLAVKSRQFVSGDLVPGSALPHLLSAFPYALRDHLRGQKPNPALIGEPAMPEAVTHLPLYISSLVYSHLNRWTDEGQLDPLKMLQLDPHARALMDVCGACERILKSPIAGSYKTLIWHGLALYLLILPWLLVPTLDNWTFVVVLMGAYFVLGLELLAEEVEQPFGTLANDLPLDSICRTIEQSVHEAMAAPAATRRSGAADLV